MVSSVLPEKLIFAQLLKTFHVFQGTQKFIRALLKNKAYTCTKINIDISVGLTFSVSCMKGKMPYTKAKGPSMRSKTY
jgi:hypothetical protein